MVPCALEDVALRWHEGFVLRSDANLDSRLPGECCTVVDVGGGHGQNGAPLMTLPERSDI